MNKRDRQKQVKRLWNKMSLEEIAQELGVSKSTIYRDRQELKLPPNKPPSVSEVVVKVRDRHKLNQERRTNREMAKRVMELEREVEAAKALNAHRYDYRIEPTPGVETEAVAVVVASDWHIEEVVHRAEVNGLNEFNEAVCHTRIGRFFRHAVKLLKKEQAGTTINTLVLAILGDMINGNIHDELMEGNRLLPIDAIIECQGHLAAGIRYILEETDVNLVIPCHSGNHGRITRKLRIATEAGNSIERLMYHALAQMFADEPRVTFIVADSYHSYLDVFDNFTIRFHHGTFVRYNGGVGGLTIPLNKAIAQWDKMRRADLDVIGHRYCVPTL